MKLLKKEIGRFPLGLWIAFIALALIFLAWIMQGYSLLDWEGAIKLGLQDKSFTGDAAERAIADVEKGVAIADMLWALPLTIVAFIGLLKKKLIGFTAAMMIFAICVYFPLFYAFRESMPSETKIAAIILWVIPSILGIAGLWVNRNYFRY